MKKYKDIKFYQVPHQHMDYTMCELDDYDMDKLLDLNIEKIVYYYGYGSYCGGGEGLAKLKNGRWYRIYFGHCSCFGHCEYIEDELKAPPFDRRKISKELDKDLKPIIDYIKKHHIK